MDMQVVPKIGISSVVHSKHIDSDNIDVVDNGACTGEDAGQLVKDLTHIQECLVSVAVGNGGTAVQIGHLVFVDHGIAGGQFHFGHHNGNSFLS